MRYIQISDTIIHSQLPYQEMYLKLQILYYHSLKRPVVTNDAPSIFWYYHLPTISKTLQKCNLSFKPPVIIHESNGN